MKSETCIIKDTPIGALCFTWNSAGLTSIDFAGHSCAHDPTPTARSSQLAQSIQQQFAEYFLGRRKKFELPVDLTHLTNFQQKVLRELSKIPHGHTTSYGQLAAHCGLPKAARAVGHVMALNPLPVLLPCHRILAAGGTLGGYSGGLHIKKILLNLEQASSSQPDTSRDARETSTTENDGADLVPCL